MSILVTGGTGFIGSNICRILVDQGRQVVAYDVAVRRLRILDDILDRMKIVRGDILDMSGLINAMKRYEVEGVIHTCALLPEAAEENIHWTIKVNVEGTTNVLEAARLMDLKRVVYTSTGAIYGYEGREDLRSVREDERPHPRGTYAVTKYMGELACQNYADIYNVDAVTLRLALIYGPGRIERGRRLTPLDIIIKNAVDRTPIRLERGGGHPQEYTYVKDVAQAAILAYEKEPLRHGVYNIGKGSLTRLSEVGEVVKRLCPELSVYIGPGLFPGESIRGSYDISRARGDLGFEPLYDIERGVKETVQHLRRLRHASISP